MATRHRGLTRSRHLLCATSSTLCRASSDDAVQGHTAYCDIHAHKRVQRTQLPAIDMPYEIDKVSRCHIETQELYRQCCQFRHLGLLCSAAPSIQFGDHVMTEVHRQCEAFNTAGLQPSNAVPSAMLQLCSNAHYCGALPLTAYILSESSAAVHRAKPMAVLKMQLTSAW